MMAVLFALFSGPFYVDSQFLTVVTTLILNVSIHPPPAFGSSPNLEALALEANDSDHEEEGSVHANSQFAR